MRTELVKYTTVPALLLAASPMFLGMTSMTSRFSNFFKGINGFIWTPIVPDLAKMKDQLLQQPVDYSNFVGKNYHKMTGDTLQALAIGCAIVAGISLFALALEKSVCKRKSEVQSKIASYSLATGLVMGAGVLMQHFDPKHKNFGLLSAELVPQEIGEYALRVAVMACGVWTLAQFSEVIGLAFTKSFALLGKGASAISLLPVKKLSPDVVHAPVYADGNWGTKIGQAENRAKEREANLSLRLDGHDRHMEEVFGRLRKLEARPTNFDDLVRALGIANRGPVFAAPSFSSSSAFSSSSSSASISSKAAATVSAPVTASPPPPQRSLLGSLFGKPPASPQPTVKPAAPAPSSASAAAPPPAPPLPKEEKKEKEKEKPNLKVSTTKAESVSTGSAPVTPTNADKHAKEPGSAAPSPTNKNDQVD